MFASTKRNIMIHLADAIFLMTAIAGISIFGTIVIMKIFNSK